MTTTVSAPPAGLELRQALVRETDTDARTFTAVAVPWDQRAAIGEPARGWGYWETFERGAVVDSDDALVFWRHGEPIGRILEARDTPAGWEVVGHLSATPEGDKAYTLLRDGVIRSVSIGFHPLEHREHTDPDTGQLTITRTKVRAAEVSLTPTPAYTGAAVTDVREHTATPTTPTTTRSQEGTTMENTPNEAPAWATELRETVDQLHRQVITGQAPPAVPAGPTFATRGALLKALVAGDETAVREYNETLTRAYDGTTLGDTAPRKGWAGDLTRLVDEPVGLRAIFATGTLPAEGNFLEYGVLNANTVAVGKQAAEGDALTFGKVTTKTETAAVETFGGYTSLSRQAIERSSVNVLNHSLRALDIAANKNLAATFRTHYAAAVAAQVTAGNTVTVADGDVYVDWVGAIIDAAIKYEDLGLPLEALVTGPTEFKRLAGLTDSAGRPLMSVSGTGVNAVGTIRPAALGGDLAGVTVRLNAKGTGAAFANGEAIRSYVSPIGRLQDENVVNLSKDFSVYYYAALANEIPAAIVPVAITA